jgi:hypothetical protein
VCNEPSSGLGPVWGHWTQRTSLRTCSCLGPLDATNHPELLFLSRPLHAKNLVGAWVLFATFVQQISLRICSCLGTSDTKNSK